MSKKHKSNITVVSSSVGGVNTAKCHEGNIVVMRSSSKTGGVLMCGGWSRGAYSDDVAVIDLTGTEPIDVSNPMKALNDSADQWFGKAIESANLGRSLPWLSFKIKDFGIPTVERATWVALTESISNLMNKGHNVLMACNGGHGRTGTAASIVCYLMNDGIGEPVSYLRNVYCGDAVETYEQHEYVHKMLNLPKPDRLEYKHDPKATYQWGGYVGYQGGGSYQGSYQNGYVWNNKSMKWEPPAPNGQVLLPSDPGNSDKKDGWWMDSLVLMLDAEKIDYSIVQRAGSMMSGLKSTNSYVEVCVFDKNSLTYYEVVNYDELTNTVKVEDLKSGGSRTMGIGFLATKEEVDAVYR